MKTIELTSHAPSVQELVALAGEGAVIIKTEQGRQFVLAEVDEFELEVELLKNSPAFLAFLEQRSKQRGATTLADLRQELGLN